MMFLDKGALIGTGVGIAAGVEVAGATTAAVEAGAVVEGANAACGGDMCASEVQDASQAVQEALPAATEAESGTLQVFNAESQGPISAHDVTVIGKYDNYLNLGKQLNANVLNDPTWTPETAEQIQNNFEQSVMANQHLVVMSDTLRTGLFAHEIETFTRIGHYLDEFPLLIPPSMQ